MLQTYYGKKADIILDKLLFDDNYPILMLKKKNKVSLTKHFDK